MDFDAGIEKFLAGSGFYKGESTEYKYLLKKMDSAGGKAKSPFCSFEETNNLENVKVKYRQVNWDKSVKFRELIVKKAKSAGLDVKPQILHKEECTNQEKKHYKPYICWVLFKFDSTSESACKSIVQLISDMYEEMYKPGAEWI